MSPITLTISLGSSTATIQLCYIARDHTASLTLAIAQILTDHLCTYSRRVAIGRHCLQFCDHSAALAYVAGSPQLFNTLF